MTKEKLVLGNAIEGESYVGKTSTIEFMKEIESLREKGVIMVPEYSVTGSLPIFPRETNTDLKESIQKIIDLEKRRTDGLVNELAKSNSEDKIIVFDRGPISCIAFEYAAEKAGYKSALLWLADAFQKEFSDSNIIIPKGMIHLTASREVIEEREKIDLEKGRGKILDFLKDPEVIKNINLVFNTFGNKLSNQLFLTLDSGIKESGQTAFEILQFIKGQKTDVETDEPDFVEFARSLLAGKSKK